MIASSPASLSPFARHPFPPREREGYPAAGSNRALTGISPNINRKYSKRGGDSRMLALLVAGCLLLGAAVSVPIVCVYYDFRPALWNIALTIALLLAGAAAVLMALNAV